MSQFWSIIIKLEHFIEWSTPHKCHTYSFKIRSLSLSLPAARCVLFYRFIWRCWNINIIGFAAASSHTIFFFFLLLLVNHSRYTVRNCYGIGWFLYVHKFVLGSWCCCWIVVVVSSMRSSFCNYAEPIIILSFFRPNKTRKKKKKNSKHSRRNQSDSNLYVQFI